MGLYDIVYKSALSLEGANPAKGKTPRNFPTYGHIQNYTPSPEGSYNFKRNEGLVADNGVKSPAVSSLDIENNVAAVKNGGTGGPKNDYTTKYPSANVTGPFGQAPKNFTYEGKDYTYPKKPGAEPTGYYNYMKENFAAK